MSRVAVIQLDSSDTEPVAERIERAARIVEALERVDVAILPELWHVGAFDLEAAKARFAEVRAATRPGPIR